MVQKFRYGWGLVANNAGLPKKLLHIQDSTYIYTITTCQVHVFFLSDEFFLICDKKNVIVILICFFLSS